MTAKIQLTAHQIKRRFSESGISSAKLGTTQFWGLLSVIFVVAYFNRQEDPDEKKPKPSGTYRVPFLSQNLSSDSPTPAAGPAAQQTMSPTVGAQRNPAAPSPGPPAPSRHMQPASKSRTLPAAGDLKSLRNREEQLKREMAGTDPQGRPIDLIQADQPDQLI